ncbi:uncharacterized protein TRIVIDRAFT_200670 [Trichoderma virens Gv29-8]|uniref:Myb-like domain-containing protein n=1 Tax=Hypocrea virens (strain Gv29-8 / FGSC 10586) TaxID=413071 RepID=G9MTJ4_HYPVG|nr:uncharacterized protein TRIVIDRAFT_200670 [Trichoderma virens Gv29-8]EHK22345.1 hypothetical protein TRIVIDRAFT_200670 [Trichoderma virens Gv29-8]UKZ47384.1 hypothetical protein TrVGV298_001602 [Trichoderma virens]
MDPGIQEKGASAWTDEAKFLLRIVAQLKGDGRGISIKWEKINIPGRTPKSLQNMWTKINKQIAEFEARESGGEGSAVAVPAKPRKRVPAGKKGLAMAVDQGDGGLDDDDLHFKQKFLMKRAAEELDDEYLGVGKKRAKVKAETTTDGAIRVKKEGK